MGERTGPRLVRRGRIYYTWVPKPGGGTRRVTTNCTDKEAARDIARKLERRAADPTYQASFKTTLQVACDRFLASRKRAGRAAGTLHHYTVKTSWLVEYMNVPLAALNIATVERYIDLRTENDKARRTTIKKELRALGAVLRHSKRVGLWSGDVEAVIPEYADDYKPRTRALAWKEALHLLRALERPAASQPVERSRNRAAMVAFILATGARWSEAVRARREDIGPDFVGLRGSKTPGATRTVPIVKVTRLLIDYALTALGTRVGRLFDRWENPNRDLEVACTQAGIAKCSPNDLRRSLATWLRVLGVDISVIAAVLGHTTSRMVERVYGRLSPAELRARMGGRLLDQQRGKGGVLKLLPAPTKPRKGS